MKTFSQNINPPPHYPRPPTPTAPPQSTGLQSIKVITQAIMQIKLMRLALDRVDRDVEQFGSVSGETIEFVRSIKGATS